MTVAGNITTDMEGKHTCIAKEILLGMNWSDNQIDIMKDCHQWCEKGVFGMTGRPRGATK